MSQYFDLSIRRIEIKKPKRDLKPVIKLQDEVNKTLLHDEYYYPTDERTIQECLDGDYILLGVYNDVGVKSPRLRCLRIVPCYALPRLRSASVRAKHVPLAHSTLPNIRISWDYHPTFMLISGRVLRSFTHL